MTDNDITIKALKELLEVMLIEGDLQRASTISHTIDLINHQEAEIEGLTAERDEARKGCAVAERNHQLAVAEREANVKGFTETLKRLKADAIKEFAERLKEKLFDNDEVYGISFSRAIDDIDNLVKEMVGGV